MTLWYALNVLEQISNNFQRPELMPLTVSQTLLMVSYTFPMVLLTASTLSQVFLTLS